MNREIKFRIWDKQYCQWLENSNSLHCYSNWTICPFTGNLVDYVGTYDGDHGDTFTASPADDYIRQGKFLRKPRYIIQQYTGLKDKNGKEIYEGDVVEFRTHNHENLATDSVVFEYGAFILKGILYDLYETEVKIIGNIFENKELLKL